MRCQARAPVVGDAGWRRASESKAPASAWTQRAAAKGTSTPPFNLQFPLRPCVLRVKTPRVIPINGTATGATFSVRLHPRGKRNAITGALGDALKISLTSPPVEGKANAACIEFLADLLKLPRSSITIAAGQTSRNKLIRVTGLSAAEVEVRLRAAASW